MLPASPSRRSGWIAAAACLAAGPVAAADPIVDRNYAIDFYDGVAIGDTAQVGMGGAGAALGGDSAGTLLNPSASAVRRTTDTDRWSWGYHLDVLTGKYSTDYDNNGTATDQASGASLLTLGVAVRVRDWSAALTATGQTAPVAGAALDAQALRAKLVVAHWFPRTNLAVGAGVQTVSFALSRSSGEAMFEITGAGLIAGATWVPAMENVRAGLAMESGIIGGEVSTSACDPADCQGYILPRAVVSPGRVIAGGAYRWAATAWNQLVPRTFRDERSLTAAADLVVTGSSPNSYGLEAFGKQELQRSGRATVVSIRGGAEYEWLPGRLRVRAGSYWEPGRFDGVGGRIHATFGVDVRVLELHLFGLRRVRISGTADLATRYRNLAVSIGFWH
ncbi:MAG TPA: hypothetical protein VN253_02295 [Kofleriaceae bacterium]|nr:hypothetical protein [Kofleriaceae bacterium]